MTIQSQLDQVLALAEKATPGPWGACNQDNGGCICGGVHSVSEERSMGVAGTGSILEDLFFGNREEDADKIAANAVLIAQAVNFLREHGPAIRAAVGGEAVPAWWVGYSDGHTGRAPYHCIGPNKPPSDWCRQSIIWKPLYASPTATVDVGALRGILAVVMQSKQQCDEDGQMIAVSRQALDELAALIGEKA